MSETTYIIDLTPDGKNRYRHRHVVEKKKVIEFRIQYEAHIAGTWHAIVRYDTAHGFAHRDVMHPDGTQTKTAFRHWDYRDVLVYGERDLKQNWAAYRQAYERELARLGQQKKGRKP